jgi:hypothetical protein
MNERYHTDGDSRPLTIDLRPLPRRMPCVHWEALIETDLQNFSETRRWWEALSKMELSCVLGAQRTKDKTELEVKTV